MNPEFWRPFRGFAYRDCTILITTLFFWVRGIDAFPAQVALGVATALCALLLHEWAHLYGACRAGAVVHPAPSILSPFLFDLDSNNNSVAAFVTTSIWGFCATGVFVVMFLCTFRGGSVAEQTALIGAGILAALTVLIEFPIAWWVARGGRIPRVEIFRRD